MADEDQLELELDITHDTSPRATGCAGTLDLQCTACGHEHGARFACTSPCRRCPWRQGRLTPILDILPRVPVRHFVVTLPEPWRQDLAHDRNALKRVRTAIMQELVAMIEGAVRQPDVRGGGVCAVHPCGASLEPNVHLHALVLDGVYVLRDGDAIFRPHAEAPSARALRKLARRLHARLLAIVPPNPKRRRVDAPRIGVAHRIALGPVAHPSPGSPRTAAGTVVDAHGIGVRAGPVVDANDRAGVARLAGYLARSIPSESAFTRGPADTIRYRLQRPFVDGTTHVEFDAAELAQRLHALGPDRGPSRITWHGVLAPRAAARGRVVPHQLDLGIASPRTTTKPRSHRRRTVPHDAPVHACPHCGAQMQIVGLEVAA